MQWNEIYDVIDEALNEHEDRDLRDCDDREDVQVALTEAIFRAMTSPTRAYKKGSVK